MVRKFYFFLQISLVLFLFLSCSNSNPDITMVTGSMIFDFADTDAPPSVRMAVFAQSNGEVQRADFIEARHRESGLMWRISKPRLFSGSNKNYAGYTNLLPMEGKEIPQGDYDFRYVDGGGNEDRGTFKISYPQALLTSKSSEVRTTVTKSLSDNLALYDETGTLIFFNKRKKNWKTNSDIQREMRNAFTLRQCLNTTDYSIICLMPEESLKEEQGGNRE